MKNSADVSHAKGLSRTAAVRNLGHGRCHFAPASFSGYASQRLGWEATGLCTGEPAV
jgi:hypothetical protein